MTSPRSTLATRTCRAAPVCIVSILGLWGTGPTHAQETPTAAADSLATETLPLEPTREISFRTDEGSWMSVDLSSDGTTLVFGPARRPLHHAGRGRNRDALPDRAPPSRASRASAPDGSEIVFVSDRSGGHNLWVMSVDGTDTTQITKGNDNLYTSPEWSPDGEYPGGVAHLQPARRGRQAVALSPPGWEAESP